MRTVLMKSICASKFATLRQKSRPAAPVSLAIIQLGTYDGTVYNARQVIDTVGHLCDYIFCLIPRKGRLRTVYPDDGGWLAALLWNLAKKRSGDLCDPVSYWKQQAGFSTDVESIKDSHIRGQARFAA